MNSHYARTRCTYFQTSFPLESGSNVKRSFSQYTMSKSNLRWTLMYILYKRLMFIEISLCWVTKKPSHMGNKTIERKTSNIFNSDVFDKGDNPYWTTTPAICSESFIKTFYDKFISLFLTMWPLMYILYERLMFIEIWLCWVTKKPAHMVNKTIEKKTLKFSIVMFLTKLTIHTVLLRLRFVLKAS